VKIEDRDHDVEFKVAGLTAERNRRVTTDHVSGHLLHGFAHYEPSGKVGTLYYTTDEVYIIFTEVISSM